MTTRASLGPGIPTASAIAVEVADWLAQGEADMALRILVDGINRLPAEATQEQLEELLAEPPSIGEERWDALLAGAIRYRLRKLGRKAPRWTWKQPLATFWWPVRINESKGYNDMAHSPVELARLGIFMDERSLGSV